MVLAVILLVLLGSMSTSWFREGDHHQFVDVMGGIFIGLVLSSLIYWWAVVR
jgi:hypothetical protein